MEEWKKPLCPYQFVVIEGNIGAGKTSLATQISEDYSAKLILERFADNPFLPKFYKDKERYALPLEMSFLADRYSQFKNEINLRDMFYPFMVADYYFMKSLIFARNTLAQDEYALYSQLFHIIHTSLPRPDLYVYLHLDTNQLLWNIQNRGRDYENGISESYLESIQTSYYEFFKQQPGMRIVILDMRNMDFVANTKHYQLIVRTLFDQSFSEGITRIIPEV